jgi:hypothetical protein
MAWDGVQPMGVEERLTGECTFHVRLTGGITMRSRSARRELAFVCGVAVAGLALVLVVVFAPWYPTGGTADRSAEVVTLTR